MALSGEDIYLRGLLYSPSSTLIPPPTILALSYCHNMNHVTVPGHWPVAHAVLYVEALTRNPPPDKPQLGWNQEFPAPWVSAQFAKYLGLAQRTPKRGVLDSLKDEKDVMLWDTHIMGDRAKFQVLRVFLDEFAKRYNGEDTSQLDAIIRPKRPKNKTKETVDATILTGAKIWLETFNKLWTRSVNAMNFDKFLTEQELMPWQRCQLLNVPWEPWLKVSEAF